MRIAVINRDTCKPNDCASGPNKPCIKYCPRNRTGDETIKLGEDGFPHLNPLLCSGCGICVKKCPFHCYTIINIPEQLESEVSHKYSPDGFTLFRMLVPSKDRVLGVIGQNGVGKSTALKILSGNLKMNFGKFEENTPDWDEIIDYFKGSILHEYFTLLKDKKLAIVHKPQEITEIPKFVQGKVVDVFKKINDSPRITELANDLDLNYLLERDINVLSGGELQRVAIAAALLRDG
ncbi:MAG: ATP-binding cassette domain-containing protein, partial [Promethearchaeota archaeon]